MKQTALSALTLALLLTGCASKNSAAPLPAAAQPKPATTLAEQGRNPAEFPAYVDKLKAQARAQGINQSTLDSAFANVHFVDRVIKSDRNQLEKKVTLDDYLARTITAAKITQARENAQRYHSQLASVSQRYGVPAQYIVALWAMESNFGNIQGREDVISALATLAFEGRREALFTKELIAALNIVQQGHISAAEMKGSWAGAMGQNQFMPSSYLRYGADADGDGKIDIWNNIDDVFASTANYLAKEGWRDGEGWGREVVLPVDFVKEQAGLKDTQAKSVGEWQKLGIRMTNSVALPDNAQRAWIILPDDMEGRAFMVYDNFRTIMHWNRSYYFAVSIGKMADAIGQ
ncbi:lytic murein transglycosylase [Erwiniaceae bacterium BAC15a-03b]|uniref:Lytic murein transglycosylase n=1 Tax=Winslowiella arboricola TaxID=2978220 RepID=A0A9J6PSH4_9GAMM|nr:lytic murein transglycosylase [Winslowiella arboricola]MCU5775787.1 lytic murein transglycosylase [Winslowiella arboricola]MCU5779363.1 lytic murein transglycosylase [Winslowiella arboricola]